MYGASSTVVARSGTSQVRHRSSNMDPNHVHASGASGPSPWTTCLAPLRAAATAPASSLIECTTTSGSQSIARGTRSSARRKAAAPKMPATTVGMRCSGAMCAEVANRFAKRGVGLGPAGPDVPRRQTTAGRFVAALCPRRHDDLVAGPVGGLGEGKQRQQVTVSRVRREEDAHGSRGPRAAIGVMETMWSSDGERIWAVVDSRTTRPDGGSDGPDEEPLLHRLTSTHSSSRPIDVGTGASASVASISAIGAVGAAGRVVDQHEPPRSGLGRQRDRVVDRGVAVGVGGRLLVGEERSAVEQDVDAAGQLDRRRPARRAGEPRAVVGQVGDGAVGPLDPVAVRAPTLVLDLRRGDGEALDRVPALGQRAEAPRARAGPRARSGSVAATSPG